MGCYVHFGSVSLSSGLYKLRWGGFPVRSFYTQAVIRVFFWLQRYCLESINFCAKDIGEWEICCREWKKDSILVGKIDTRIHCGPDPVFEHRYDALEISKLAEGSGMRVIVLKSHSYPTAAIADLVKKQVNKLNVFGVIFLNSEVRGINSEAVYTCAETGGKVIWMPPFSADYCLRKLGRNQKRGILFWVIWGS